MEFKRINLSVTDAADSRLDELDRELRQRIGTPKGGGWRSRIVSMLVAQASVEDLEALVKAERKAA